MGIEIHCSSIFKYLKIAKWRDIVGYYTRELLIMYIIQSTYYNFTIIGVIVKNYCSEKIRSGIMIKYNSGVVFTKYAIMDCTCRE